jgi:hypothetical protein
MLIYNGEHDTILLIDFYGSDYENGVVYLENEAGEVIHTTDSSSFKSLLLNFYHDLEDGKIIVLDKDIEVNRGDFMYKKKGKKKKGGKKKKK